MEFIARLGDINLNLELVGVFQRKKQSYAKCLVKVLDEERPSWQEPVFREVILPITSEVYRTYESALNNNNKVHNRHIENPTRYILIKGRLEVSVEQALPF